MNNIDTKNIDFSVSMCVYNGDNPLHFDIALDSIIVQTIKPSEIVLVVDGPIQELTEKIIDKYNSICNKMNISFCVYRFNKNKGHGEARRLSFEKCSYEYIALMDADDICEPDRFEKQLSFMISNPDISIVGGNITEFINQIDGRDYSKKAGSRIVPKEDYEIKQYMKKRCPMNQVTVLFKKNDVQSVGGYIDWYCEEDYYLWLRMAQCGYKFANLQANLVNVRVGEEMYLRRGGLKYFLSETKLQLYMFKNKIISLPRCSINICERFILQVLLPNKIRAYLFQKIARE